MESSFRSVQERNLASAIGDLKENFARYWAAAFGERNDGTIALTAPASYRLDIDGVRLLIDPVFRFQWQKEAVKDRWKADLSAADAVIYTHSHADHYDPETVRELEAIRNILEKGANGEIDRDFVVDQRTIEKILREFTVKKAEDGCALIGIGPEYRTVWYEIKIR